MNQRRLTLGALTLLTLATAAGCGKSAVPTAAPENAMNAARGTMVVQGVTRKLGYDVDRYENVLAKLAKPVRMPRQGLLRSAVDNRSNCSAIADQGKLGSCTAFAMGKGLREYMQRKNGERQESLSALFHYYEIRSRIGQVGQDSGGTITDGMKVLKETGIAPETTWPYDIAQFTVKPPEAAYSAAGEFKVKEITQVKGLDDVKTVLSSGQAVAFGFVVHKSFMKIGADGVMPMPGLFMDPRLGGHAVLAVGYDDAKKQLIVRNSWSDKWGDHGYFYMPYDYVNKPGKVMDFWTAK